VIGARAALAALAVLGVTTAGCGGGNKLAQPSGVTDEARAAAASRRPSGPSSQIVVGHLLGVGDRTLGPFLARAGDGKTSVAGWVSGADGTGRKVITVPLSGVGEPRGAAKIVANAGTDTTTLVVKPVRGRVPGTALAWTTLTDRGEALWSVVVGEDASPRSKPVELARTTDDIVWVDVVPTDVGALCLWAEETRGGDANVLAAALDTDGKVHGAPVRVAHGVTGWHAIEIPGGVGVSVLTSPAGVHVKTPERGGSLVFHRLDAEGRSNVPPTTVVPKPVVSGDVEVARTGDRFVFAWTDRTGEEPVVTAATLDDTGRVEPVHRLVEARGGAALLGLAGGPAGAAVMWEAPARRTGDVRHVYTAHVSREGVVDGRTSTLDAIGRGAPELAATPTGFAILAPVRDCEPKSPRCPDAPIVPTLLRLDERGTPIQREAFTFGSDPASMGWGLTCNGTDCLALAASGSAPATRVRAAEVRPRTNLAPPPEITARTQSGPRVADIVALVSGERVLDLAVTPLGETTLVATLSSTPSSAAVKGASQDARSVPHVLATRLVEAGGEVSAPIVLTTRALAVGGVAIAPSEKPEDGAAVAWVARDNGDPEVHVTKVDRKGKKTGEVQLTTIKGDASDVAIVPVSGGWIVAWIDGRDGNGEVYATRLGADLSRSTGERITRAPGDATDLVAMVRGDLVWLAWSDPRDSQRDGMADVWAAAVRARDAKPAIDEQRLLATAAHSRTPHLASNDQGIQIAWIEEAPMGVENPGASGYGAMWATLAIDGKVVRRPTRLPLGGEGAATAVALAGHGAGLRAVVARSHDGLALDAIELTSLTAAPQVVPLVSLDGPSSLDVVVVLEGDDVYFNDDGPRASDKRARRARVTWTP